MMIVDHDGNNKLFFSSCSVLASAYSTIPPPCSSPPPPLAAMLSYSRYPYSASASSSASSSPSRSSPLEWSEWVPECLQPAIALASDLSFPAPHHHHYHLQPPAADASPAVSDDEHTQSLDGSYILSTTIPMHSPRRSRRPQSHDDRDRQIQQQSRSISCLSCKVSYSYRAAGTCRECYDEATETKEALKKEIEELYAQIAFLKAWAPEAMDEGCADVVLECPDGSKIRAHRAVLMSRSSVFRAMLQNEMEESRTNIIRISDFSHEVLRLFIHYLYTAEIYPESLSDCAFDLLALAEKYHVIQLKSMCERFLISKVNSGNALVNFEYASVHGANTLREAALNMIMENINELPSKSEYRDLVNREPRLVVEIFEAFLLQKLPTGKFAAQ